MKLIKSHELSSRLHGTLQWKWLCLKFLASPDHGNLPLFLHYNLGKWPYFSFSWKSWQQKWQRYWQKVISFLFILILWIDVHSSSSLQTIDHIVCDFQVKKRHLQVSKCVRFPLWQFNGDSSHLIQRSTYGKYLMEYKSWEHTLKLNEIFSGTHIAVLQKSFWDISIVSLWQLFMVLGLHILKRLTYPICVKSSFIPGYQC